ncbi:MAG: hypothetical protein LBU47_01285 [Christensenellaceae bacterium]|jgi:hypothetical protein|nr:hypothetical protein [Christensenellaceae bacterium]
MEDRFWAMYAQLFNAQTDAITDLGRIRDRLIKAQQETERMMADAEPRIIGLPLRQKEDPEKK